MTVRPTDPDGRFAQLTYTSFDSGAGSAGWQVKETSSDLSGNEREDLTGRIATRLEVGTVPMFPTPEEIEQFPRRLVYGRLRDGQYAYWHTALAGMDASGRPGNVFVHALVDRRPEADDDLRPIDLWRSPDWLTPFNPEQVVLATLGHGPRPGSRAGEGRRRAVDFVLDPQTWRIGVLTVLLDAVAAAMEGGPTVVLGVDDVDDAAGWLTAVSHVMSPGTARTMCFSTYERAGTVKAALDAGLHVICVPRSDVAALSRELVAVVIDGAEAIRMGSLDTEPHETANGTCIAVTPWSGLAQVVVAETEVALAALAEADSLARLVGDVGLAPAWPLAATVLCNLETFRDARSDAARAVLTSCPPLDAQPGLAATVAAGVRSVVGAEARDAWSHLDHLRADQWSAAASVVLDVYVRGVLDDTAWLMQPGQVPVPDESAPAPRIEPAIALARVTSLAQRSGVGGDSPEALAAEALRLADFLVRARVIEGLPPRPAEVLRDALETEVQRIAVPALLGRNAADVVETAGMVDPVILRLVRDLLTLELSFQVQSGSARALGERVPTIVLEWLLPDLPDADSATVEAAIAQWSRVDLVGAEGVVQQYLAAPTKPSALACLVVALEEQARLGAVTPELDVTRLAAAAQMDMADLATLSAAYGALVPDAIFLPALKREPLTVDLQSICRQVAPLAWEDGLMWGRPPGPTMVDRLVRLRRTASFDWWECFNDHRERTDRALWLHRCAMDALLDIAPDIELDSLVLAHAQAAWLFLEVFAVSSDDARGVDRLLEHVASGAAAEVLLNVANATVGASNALLLGALYDRESPLPYTQGNAAAVSSLRVNYAGKIEPVLDAVVRRESARPDRDHAAFVESAFLTAREQLGAAQVTEAFRRFLEQRVRRLGSKNNMLNTTIGKLRRG